MKRKTRNSKRRVAQQPAMLTIHMANAAYISRAEMAIKNILRGNANRALKVAALKALGQSTHAVMTITNCTFTTGAKS